MLHHRHPIHICWNRQIHHLQNRRRKISHLEVVVVLGNLAITNEDQRIFEGVHAHVAGGALVEITVCEKNQYFSLQM